MLKGHQNTEDIFVLARLDFGLIKIINVIEQKRRKWRNLHDPKISNSCHDYTLNMLKKITPSFCFIWWFLNYTWKWQLYLSSFNYVNWQQAPKALFCVNAYSACLFCSRIAVNVTKFETTVKQVRRLASDKNRFNPPFSTSIFLR